MIHYYGEIVDPSVAVCVCSFLSSYKIKVQYIPILVYKRVLWFMLQFHFKVMSSVHISSTRS